MKKKVSTLDDGMRTFVIHGPFTVVKLSINAISFFRQDDPKILFGKIDGASSCANHRGCYIFAKRFGDSFTPLYVGKTKKQDFQSEAFALHKQKKCIMELVKPSRGELVLFLLSPDRKPRLVSKEILGRLEKYLIREAALRNPDLWNEYGTKPDPFRIAGIHGARRGKKACVIASFKKMLFS